MSSSDTQSENQSKASDTVDWSSSEDRSADDVIVRTPRVSDPPAYMGDRSFFKLVVRFTGISLLLCIAGMLFLSYFDKEIPDGIVATASGLVGLLTSIFAVKSHSQ